MQTAHSPRPRRGHRLLVGGGTVLLASIVFLAISWPSQGNPVASTVNGDGDGVVAVEYYSEPTGTDLDLFTHVPMSPGMRTADRTATFKVKFDSNVPPEARAVFQTATDLWAVFIESPIPIEVEVKWMDLAPAVDPKSDKPAPGIILGRARPTAFRRDFVGAPKSDVWYPHALANRLAQKDIDPDKSDIVAMFNHKVPWYYGTDGATPRGKYDLLTVMLHELGHGLGFASSMKVEGTEASWGIKDREGKRSSPTIFDTFVKNQAGKSVLDTTAFPNPSAALLAELTGRKLFFAGRLAAAAYGGAMPPLHAPSAFKTGASFVHLAENQFPPGNLNSLLTPTTFRAEAVHHPGPVAVGMLRDMGWGHMQPSTVANQAADLLVVIEAIGMPVQRAGQDRYDFPFRAGDKAAVSVIGPGELILTVQDKSGNLIKELRGSDKLAADFVPAATGSYRIAISNSGQANTRYTLTTRCADLATAPIQIHRTIDAREEDRVKITLGAGQNLRASLKGDGDTNLDLFVDDPTGNEIARGVGPTDQETATWRTMSAGSYTVRVRSLGRIWNEYTLTIGP